VFADLGVSPLSNAYLEHDLLSAPQQYFPLCALVCSSCFLVQLEEYDSTPEEIFSDYAYFSSYSTTWLEHAQRFAQAMTERLGLGRKNTVVEVASNDGYLLQYFRDLGIRVLGVEPAGNVAAVAQDRGIDTVVRFFGTETARALRAEGYAADLLVGNNVLAHVPGVNDFVGGLKELLKPTGVITMEFPHLMRLIDNVQFDTIYHEHFSYLSFSTVSRIFAAHGLTLFDVEELPTHGGSLRIYARHEDDATKPVSDAAHELLQREADAGYDRLETYLDFAERVKAAKRRILSFFIAAKDEAATIVAYGAAAKGNTLLNYCGLGTDFIDYVVDRSPHKQGRYLPGTRIPIRAPEQVTHTRPDYLFILPWNLKDEIIEQMCGIRDWDGKFIVTSPEVVVLP
jgi:2-polyprenyl-3-methyl-5-hydroxy-6-metoxy-1,4-benzoquinol methylase